MPIGSVKGPVWVVTRPRAWAVDRAESFRAWFWPLFGSGFGASFPVSRPRFFNQAAGRGGMRKRPRTVFLGNNTFSRPPGKRLISIQLDTMILLLGKYD